MASGLRRLQSQASVDVGPDGRKWKNWDTGASYGGNRSTAFGGLIVPGRRKFITEQISRGLRQALRRQDETFLACMCLADSEQFGLVELPLPQKEDTNAEIRGRSNSTVSRGSCGGGVLSSAAAAAAPSLSEFFSEMATEERKKSDLIFQCLFSSGGGGGGVAAFSGGGGAGNEEAAIFYSGEEEDEELDESPSRRQVPQSDPMESLKWIIQRRADQVARLLQLKGRAEETNDAVAAALLSDLRLFRIGEDTNKRAREIIMFLEVQERSKINKTSHEVATRD